MMWLLTSANDAILVTLTFMLPLEFDSNLCRYNFPDRYASAGIWFQSSSVQLSSFLSRS